MKKHLLFAAGLIASAGTLYAHEHDADSVRNVTVQQVEVISTRATSTTPVAFTNIGKEQLSREIYGQDMPFLLLSAPSVVATSDAGTGVGYTSIRVRGTDATRINITANGIPMNDAESHGMFWVNTPDLASSLEDIQIQRGVGTSTSGPGAFGASINLQTEAIPTNPFVELSGTYGTYNTHRESLKIGTGLLGGRWAFTARLSNIHSDGYVRRASADMKSYFAQGAYYGKTTTVKLITFGGKEETYHAWNGVDADQMRADRRYNPSGEIAGQDGKVIPGLFYENQIDHYRQTNYQLHVRQLLADRWSMNAALHYTDGFGYYEEYKNARTLVEYGLSPFEKVTYDDAGNPVIEKVKKSNIVRRKNMDNRFGGGVFSFDYASDRLTATIGGGGNHYDGDHFGNVLWVQNYALFNDNFQPDHEYYNNKGKKTDINFYAKANWQVTGGLHLFGDVQYRHIRYQIDGANDRWDWINEKMQELAVDNKYDFFNPKAGAYYRINEHHNVYASFSVAHKEPTRNNFTDSKENVTPKSERMFDYEAGYNFASRFFSASVNLYYMDYKDQLILTGEINHIGEPLADNIPDSYRMGIEVMAGARFTNWLRWDINATFSRNKIKNYTEYLDDYDDNWNSLYTQTSNYIGTTTISFSPSVIVNSVISADWRNWNVAFSSNYVSKQYLTNSEQEELRLDAYFVNNLRINHTFHFKTVKKLIVGVTVNNIFNHKYVSNGWGSSSLIYTDKGQNTQSVVRSNYAGYFPQAGINVLGNIVLRF